MAQPSEEVARVLEKLDGVRRSGSGWVAHCPCRDDDENQSLSVGQGANGKVLLNCHTGRCNFEQIIEALEHKTPNDISAKKSSGKETLKLVTTYDYVDEGGVLLFQKQRFVDSSGRKKFMQRRPDDSGGWVYNLGDVPRVLYNLPEVVAAVAEGRKVYVVEGEKDADTLIALGRVATTCPNGAGTWQDIHTEPLIGATVEIVADNDDVGRDHAEFVRQELLAVGCKVRVWRSPQGKDITDWLAMGGELSGLIRVNEDGSEEHHPVLQSEDRSPFDIALEQVSHLFDDQSLSDTQKIVKATTIISAINQSETDAGRLVEWQTLSDEVDKDTYEWVIPGVLERQERVIVVAAEGVGKSTLARQVAILAASGIQPFTLGFMEPVRTLYVDLENPERIVRRNSRPIVLQAGRFGHVQSPNAFVVIKPSGYNLLSAADRQALEGHIEATEPDIVFMGPLYKSFVDVGGRTAEAVAVDIARYLDYVRDTYNCALWLEHHAPLGSGGSTREMRPFGSAVWSRWPEFGLALTPDPLAEDGYVYNVGHFRGEREPRRWPRVMRRGQVFPFESLEFYGD